MTADRVMRRTLRFESLEELQAELAMLEAAHRSGHLRTTGNWTAGQIFAHVAAWIEYGYDGYPMDPPLLPIRWILRLMLPKMLRDGMNPGVRIPGIKGGTTGADQMETPAAIDRLRTAIGRLSRGEPGRFHSPAFGVMSDEDRIRLTLRHAELHLGFLATD